MTRTLHSGLHGKLTWEGQDFGTCAPQVRSVILYTTALSAKSHCQLVIAVEESHHYGTSRNNRPPLQQCRQALMLSACAGKAYAGEKSVLRITGQGCRVTLERVVLKDCSVVVDGGACTTFQDCTFKGCYVAVMATGAQSTARLTSCRTSACGYALCADREAAMHVTQSQMRGCRHVAVDVRALAHMTLTNCRISAAVTALKRPVKGLPCKSHPCPGVDRNFVRNLQTGPTAVLVRGAASASLHDCDVSETLEFGLLVKGAGSKLDATSCQISANLLSGIWVGEGARATLHGCKLICNSEQGAKVTGSGSRLDATECRMIKNSKNGVLVQDGAAVMLQGCTLESNSAGAQARGSGSTLTTKACTQCDNANQRVWAHSDAVLTELA